MIATPQTPAIDLSTMIERRIVSSTHGRVRDLRVEVAGGSVVLRGRVATYYTKQLALHGALDELGDAGLIDEIQVG
jgi:hypothetical protein